MRVTIHPADESDEGTLDNLMQLYAHDFSEIVPLEVAENERFEGHPLGRYWVDPWRLPFILRRDEKLAGFALVHTRSHLTGEDGGFDMAEFFVLRGLRRSGVGRAAAVQLFDRLRGPWEVRQRRANIAATAFWRRTIDAYTTGRWEELDWDDDVWRGPVQRFRSVTSAAS
jgi:predicted acetyltransferase